MKRQTIKLTEDELNKIVKESVNKVLSEGNSLLDDLTPVNGANYEYLAKKIYVALQNDDLFKSFTNAILHFSQKGDVNRLTTIGQKLVSNLCSIARYYAQYNKRSTNNQ